MSEAGIVGLVGSGATDLERPAHTAITQAPLSAKQMREAAKAARAGGMVVLDVRKLKAKARIGSYITELGAVNLGRSYVICNLEHIEGALAEIDAEIKVTSNPELRMELMKARNAVFDSCAKTSEILIKSAAADHVAKPPPPVRPAFTPGEQMAIPIQININNTTKEKIEAASPNAISIVDDRGVRHEAKTQGSIAEHPADGSVAPD